MKRITCAVLAILLAMSMLLVGCADTAEEIAETSSAVGETTAAQTSEETTTEDLSPVTVTSTYMPTAISTAVFGIFEDRGADFEEYTEMDAPYTIRDVFNISNGVLKSITIPVIGTKKADANGDFILTMYVVKNSWVGLHSAPLKTYQLKVNGAAHGLQANAKVYKSVKVDLSGYGIELNAEETLAFFRTGDTLIPGYLAEDAKGSNEALNVFKKDFDQIAGSFSKVGKSDMATSLNTIFFDFEFDRTYQNRAAYQAVLDEETAYQNKIAELRKKYEGKYLSVIGDSISTYEGISNNTDYNKTIGNNAVYYPTSSSNFYDYTYTYWGRLMTDLGMKLAVNNAWSGSRAYGGKVSTYDDNMLKRATELDNDNGTPNDPSDDINPDVILIYLSVNDLNRGSPKDDALYNKLIAPNANQTQILNEWFAGVQETADKSNGKIIAGTTFKSWEASYALSLQAMKEKYPNAEIYCMLLVGVNHTRVTASAVVRHNTFITAIAEYMGATVIDQENNGMFNSKTCHAYGGDATAVHPSSYGHKMIERLIVETIYEKKKNS